MSTKVFVGNLAFRTTDQALQEAFSVCGEVKSGVIITRGRRSLGYGFVEFSTTEQAAASVDKMNKAEISGRQIKVELAKDISEFEVPAQPEGGEVGPAKRRRRARDENEGNDANNNSSGANDSNAGAQNNASGNTENRRPKKPRKKNTSNRNNANNDNNNSNTSAAPKQPREPREPREPKEARPPREPREPREPKEAREPREPREPRPPREKVPSKTTLFVANLPFSVDDVQLLKAFADTKAKAAHVVRTRTGRSRGYGFVEFENEADQLDALKTANGKEIAGEKSSRNISVTISNSPPPAPVTAAAPASGAPTPASPAAPATN